MSNARIELKTSFGGGHHSVGGRLYFPAHQLDDGPDRAIEFYSVDEMESARKALENALMALGSSGIVPSYERPSNDSLLRQRDGELTR